MPDDLVTGEDAKDVAAYVAFATGKPGEDEGALAQAGLAGATTGEQIFTAAGCGGCHKLRQGGLATATSARASTSWPTPPADREPGKSAEQYVRESIIDPERVRRRGLRQA